jgi:hypothetical protein
VSPARKQEAVCKLVDKFATSERRACRVLGQSRASQRRRPQPRTDEARLVERMLGLVRLYPRYGYRFITAKLRQEGWHVNAKRIYLSAVATGRAESAEKEAKTASFGPQRQRLPSAAGRAQGPRLVLGLRVRSHREWRRAQVALDRRRVYAGVPVLEGGPQHHQRGRDRHARGAVRDAGVPRTCAADHRCASVPAARSSSPMPSSGGRRNWESRPCTSNQEPPGRTATPRVSTAASAMSF